MQGRSKLATSLSPVELLGIVVRATSAAKLSYRSSRFHLQRDSRRLIQCFPSEYRSRGSP
jgi:hypothetical protein